MRADPLTWRVGNRVFECGPRTLVMGILNTTPDSFSDGGRYLDPGAAVARGLQMVDEGADLLDVGGESTRPGAAEVPAVEEIRRVVPVIERLVGQTPVPVSVDTRKAAVARAATAAGAIVVNDVSAGADPGMFEAVREAKAGMVLMHMRGDPSTMRELTEYEDVAAEVHDHLRGRVAAAVAAGIPRERLVVDPGIGFAKTAAQSLVLLRRIGTLRAAGRPVLVGPSRKSFLAHVLGEAAGDRLAGTAGAVAWAAAAGADIVRVHDVREMVQVVRVVDAIGNAVDERAGDRAG